MSLVDRYNRRIGYLRISVTDRCNLNCRYCSPMCLAGSRAERQEILTYEEITRLAEAAVSAGISMIRLTGGEPLIRGGLVDLCHMLSGIDGLKSLSLTTNGTILKDKAAALAAAGVKRINISLDTLNRHRFAAITGRPGLDEVLEGITAAEEAGMSPIKINTVVMRGVNDDEMADLAALTYDKPYHVRFIELMPFLEASCGDFDQMHIPISEMIRRIPGVNLARLEPSADNPGPARLCRQPGARGRIGFIAPVSWHFCGTCNRLRLTADGKIRSCLFSNRETDVKQPLRRGALQDELQSVFAEAARLKPRGHKLCVGGQGESSRGMQAIGG